MSSAEDKLRTILLEKAARYMLVTGKTRSGIGRMVNADGALFDRLSDAGRTFSLRTFDSIMTWFDANWPEDDRDAELAKMSDLERLLMQGESA